MPAANSAAQPPASASSLSSVSADGFQTVGGGRKKSLQARPVSAASSTPSPPPPQRQLGAASVTSPPQRQPGAASVTSPPAPKSRRNASGKPPAPGFVPRDSSAIQQQPHQRLPAATAAAATPATSEAWSGQWPCKVCTYLNTNRQAKCEMCSAIRGADVASAAPGTVHFAGHHATPRPYVAALGPGDKMERPGDFHLFVASLPSVTTPAEILEYVRRHAEPFQVKRLIVRYQKELEGNRQGGKEAVDVSGPTEEPHVIARALVEFYPSQGLADKLREFTKPKPRNMIARVSTWSKSYCVPFFPLDSGGAGGRKICLWARRQCWKESCQEAHEPEGWGVVRFDGKDPALSLPPPAAAAALASTAMLSPSVLPVTSALAPPRSPQQLPQQHPPQQQPPQQQPPQQHPPQQLPRMQPSASSPACCNGCGLDHPASELLREESGASYCAACIARGVPKADCATCERKTFTLNLDDTGVCSLCATRSEETFAGPAAAPHLRVSGATPAAAGGRQVPSRYELKVLLEAALGLSVARIDFAGDGDLVPVAAAVRFESFGPEQAARAQQLKATAVPGCELAVVLGRGAAGLLLRRRALAKLVALGELEEDEFSKLVEWYRLP